MRLPIAIIIRTTLTSICLLITATALAAPQLPALNEPASGIELPGKFTWFDLATPAMSDQKAFYNSVFGWSFSSLGRTDDEYTLILNKGQLIGGMFSYRPSEDVLDGAVWVALMSVENPDKSRQIVEANGGSVEVAPSQVSLRGRHALFRDPAGALFGVLHSDSGDPPDVEVAIGEFFWVDLFAHDVEKMTAFYALLAPYEVTSQAVTENISRTILRAHNLARAGIVAVDEEANRSAWVPYVRVEDVVATLEKVVEGGGFATVPPDENLLDGNLAVFVDPNGGVMGIVKWDYEGKARQ